MEGGFDVDSFYAALDAERRARELTWAALTRELNATFAHRPDIPRISASTLTGMRAKGGLNGNIVVHALMWLRRTPEDFAPGHPVKGKPLPELQTGFLPRWDGPALFSALDTRRLEHRLTWPRLADEIGHVTPGTLHSVRVGVGFPRVMRILGWLERPAADFVVNVAV